MLAREPADRLGVDSDARRDALGREPRRDLRDLVEVRDEIRRRAELHQPLGEQHVDDREQQQRVRARPDEVVLARLRRGLAAPRIDHDELAAARSQRVEPPG